jgi:hypothetical protein
MWRVHPTSNNDVPRQAALDASFDVPSARHVDAVVLGLQCAMRVVEGAATP